MQETFTPETLISYLYHSNEEISDLFLDSVFSDEFLMNSFITTAEKMYPDADISTQTIQNLHQFASSFVVPGSKKIIFMS